MYAFFTHHQPILRHHQLGDLQFKSLLTPSTYLERVSGPLASGLHPTRLPATSDATCMFGLSVMPKSRNLPMTTREPISDAKAREFLLPSSSWNSHQYRRSSYREEPQVLDYIAYIGSIHGKKGFLGRGMSDWSLSFEGLCVGS